MNHRRSQIQRLMQLIFDTAQIRRYREESGGMLRRFRHFRWNLRCPTNPHCYLVAPFDGPGGAQLSSCRWLCTNQRWRSNSPDLYDYNGVCSESAAAEANVEKFVES